MILLKIAAAEMCCVLCFGVVRLVKMAVSVRREDNSGVQGDNFQVF